ncbi:hypothetical protein, partial [Staphylococcus epidermidis]|uniref:hypothetical protein n=1 Tax=Staphylococcus epidermidis TaxID=1282 RepID=UPI001C92FA92
FRLWRFNRELFGILKMKSFVLGKRGDKIKRFYVGGRFFWEVNLCNFLNEEVKRKFMWLMG